MRCNIILRLWHFIPKCNPFAYAALFLKLYGFPVEFQVLFWGVPSAKWWTQLINKNAQFFHISDKRNTSFRERAGLENTTNKEDWTFRIGILHASRKWSSILAGTWLLWSKECHIITAICKQYSHPYRIFRKYCVDALHFLTLSLHTKTVAASWKARYIWCRIIAYHLEAKRTF